MARKLVSYDPDTGTLSSDVEEDLAQRFAGKLSKEDADATYVRVEDYVPGDGGGLPVALEEVSMRGDSLTRSEGVDYPTNVVAPILGIPVSNAGRAGWASSDIAMLQGGLQPKLTVTGNAIPASGAVTVTAIDPATSWRTDGTGAFSWLGTLAGVPGTLRHQFSDNTWTFTRTTAGEVTPCPAGTKFICTEGNADVVKVQTFFAGRNNLTSGGPILNDVVRDIDLMVRHLKQSPKRYVVVGMIPRAAANEWYGGSVRKQIDQLNEWLKMRHGDHYFDLNTPFVAYGLALAGLPATGQDLQDIANGVMPISLRGEGDTTHPNAAGYAVVGKLIANKLAQLGYSIGKLPAVIPGKVVGGTAGAATSTTQALSWTATAGADGYLIQRKRPTDSAFALAQTSGTATATVTGLEQGLEYQYRVARSPRPRRARRRSFSVRTRSTGPTRPHRAASTTLSAAPAAAHGSRPARSASSPTSSVVCRRQPRRGSTGPTSGSSTGSPKRSSPCRTRETSRSSAGMRIRPTTTG
jgi:hypothetical protein